MAIVPLNFPTVLRLGSERQDLLKHFRHVIVGGGAIPQAHVTAAASTMPGVLIQKCSLGREIYIENFQGFQSR
jgi:hypothetical protein